MEYIAFDCHKRYTFVSVEDAQGRVLNETRIEHERGALAGFLAERAGGSPVAVETVGNWYWIVDEVEQAGMVPKRVDARKAKLMMAGASKTDRLDCHGLNRLQRSGTLPAVWIPSAPLRDFRDLPRTRMMFTQHMTRLKNRIHAEFAKYGTAADGASDLFGKRGRLLLDERLKSVPPHTRFSIERLFEQLDLVGQQIQLFERRIKETLSETVEWKLLQTLPGVGTILATVILAEVGEIKRFPCAAQYASYAGTTPRVSSSGDKTHYGRLRLDINHYLKWAYMEAANSVSRNQRSLCYRHVGRLYQRVRYRRGHQKAVGAVARHLAEATYWVLTKGEPYSDPENSKKVLSTEG